MKILCHLENSLAFQCIFWAILYGPFFWGFVVLAFSAVALGICVLSKQRVIVFSTWSTSSLQRWQWTHLVMWWCFTGAHLAWHLNCDRYSVWLSSVLGGSEDASSWSSLHSWWKGTGRPSSITNLTLYLILFHICICIFVCSHEKRASEWLFLLSGQPWKHFRC